MPSSSGKASGIVSRQQASGKRLSILQEWKLWQKCQQDCEYSSEVPTNSYGIGERLYGETLYIGSIEVRIFRYDSVLAQPLHNG